MTATVEKFRAGRELLDVQDDGKYRRVRYRWHVDETSGEDFTRQRIEPVSRAILEDRWDGLVNRGLESSELQERLDGVLWDLVAGLIRRESSTSDTILLEDSIQDVDSLIDIDGLEAVIRDWLLEKAEKVAL